MTTLTAAEAADLFRREPDRHLDVGGGEVAYRCVGDGPDVLFVHGWPVNSATYRTLLPHLAPQVTCHLLDLPGTGSSRWDETTPLSIENHISSVKRSVELLGLERVAVVGHDSGGMIGRHALAGDPRVSAMGLINTEQPSGLSWRFRAFLSIRGLPGIARSLGWVAGQRRLRRNPFVLGDAFADSSLLDGEFDEFFLQPLHTDRRVQQAAIKLLRSFDRDHVTELAALHARIDVPVRMVWGDRDPFFPLAAAREMVGTFPNAELAVIEGAGLFSHEERPAEVADALLPTLTGQA
ncbi:MAG: alpha/beta hydrolase [Actinomycetota bacterium]